MKGTMGRRTWGEGKGEKRMGRRKGGEGGEVGGGGEGLPRIDENLYEAMVTRGWGESMERE